MIQYVIIVMVIYVKKHKLGCLSFSLGNIRPLYRSLKAHYLIAIARHEDITRYGIDKILRPFVEELKLLYCDGLSISIGGQETTLYGGLLAFLADNLAAHSIGGFKESLHQNQCRRKNISRNQTVF